MKLRFGHLLSAAGVLAIASSAQAAFIVGAHSSEKGNANFTSTGGSASAPSAAVGLTGTSSLFGGTATDPVRDTYTFTYTPGTDADNTAFTTGEILGSTTGFPGNGNVATGLTGGVSGTYNVYFTAPESTNVSGGGSDFTLTQNGPSIVINDVDQNNGGTGPDTDPSADVFVGGANNAWFLLGTVNLEAGNTYTVTMEANSNTFVSQRAHAVMWELAAPIPEPAAVAMLGLGLGGLGLRRRRD